MAIALNVAVAGHAAPIYKCVDPQGAISFQSQPCPGKATQTEVAVRKDPAEADTPEAAAPADAPSPPAEPMDVSRRPAPSPATARAPEQKEAAVSYECTVSNGWVFYRHQHCPAEAPAPTEPADAQGNNSHVPRMLPVKERVVAREDACQKIHAPSAGERAGNKMDQQTQNYEKLVNRDPCR